MNTNQLEQILLKNEIQLLNKEITKGLEIISAAFEKYGLTAKNNERAILVSNKDMQEFHDYVNSLKIASSYYYAGDWFHASNPLINADNPPDFVKNVLAKYAAHQFMIKVEQIEEIRSIAEQALNQSGN